MQTAHDEVLAATSEVAGAAAGVVRVGSVAELRGHVPPLAPGDVIFFTDLTMHRSGVNVAQTVRWSADWAYELSDADAICPPLVPPAADDDTDGDAAADGSAAAAAAAASAAVGEPDDRGPARVDKAASCTAAVTAHTVAYHAVVATYCARAREVVCAGISSRRGLLLLAALVGGAVVHAHRRRT